jgi:glucose-6-phosphate isomerase
MSQEPGPRALWERFRRFYFYSPELGIGIDPSRVRFGDGFLRDMEEPCRRAFAAMRDLEAGAILNPTENRRVGHYWLRAPERAPDAATRDAILEAQARVKRFAADVHSGKTRPQRAERFRRLLLIGIGGSALGPQLASDALGGPADPISLHSLDNTDPEGMDRVFDRLGPELAETLTVVISKSGGTKETRNGMLEAAARYRAAGLAFERHAAAVTQPGSGLAREAQGWVATFPLWDWVGGRTSELSPVGLLPAALEGFDVDALLAGARAMDDLTRREEPLRNPASLLALSWHHAGGGHGKKDLVVLPYCDRLLLFSRYLQQLVMESLGKERDLEGRVVHQGLSVYGNKGSTDQHAYVQQLRDGLDNFFAAFIEVRQDRQPGAASIEVEPGRTSGDYLGGFLRGTREALTGRGRESITIDLLQLDARRLGALIALFERTVGFYAQLIGINAYDQPGVEAGKKAAEDVLRLKDRVVAELRSPPGAPRTAEEIAAAIGDDAQVEMVFHVLRRMAANGSRTGVVEEAGDDPSASRYAVR